MSLGLYILNDKGEPVACPDVERWGAWLSENLASRHLAKNVIDGWLVSTVFLGIDHSFGGGPPLLFETMVFAPAPGEAEDVDWMGERQWRYATRQEAVDGHQRAVEVLEAELARGERSAREILELIAAKT